MCLCCPKENNEYSWRNNNITVLGPFVWTWCGQGSFQAQRTGALECFSLPLEFPLNFNRVVVFFSVFLHQLAKKQVSAGSGDTYLVYTATARALLLLFWLMRGGCWLFCCITKAASCSIMFQRKPAPSANFNSASHFVSIATVWIICFRRNQSAVAAFELIEKPSVDVN